MMGCFLFIL